MNASYTTPEESYTTFSPVLPKELRTPETLLMEEVPSHCPCYNLQQNKKDLEQLFPYTFHQKLLKPSKSKDPDTNTPLRVGILLSGGPAPGGHSVIAGLFDGLKKIHPESVLLGFSEGGKGLLEGIYTEITEKNLQPYRNSGGFNFIGTGRQSIVVEEGKRNCLKTATDLNLDGLVIVGGDGSNTGTAILADYFAAHGCKTTVVGVPKTIDGDLCHSYLDLTFGFDSATKFYSHLIGNIARDALSCKGMYHFIKLMGRSASHIALECAFQTHPNMVLIGEEILAKKMSLKEIITEICDVIAERAAMNKYYGVILIPEGIIEFIPEISELVQEIASLQQEDLESQLSEKSRHLLKQFHPKIQKQLLYDRDAHGNVYVSKIQVDTFLIDLVEKELREHYKDVPFYAVSHFLGYEGRCCLPTIFDNEYGYALGVGAAVLLNNKNNGYLSCLTDLVNPSEKRRFKGIPITQMLTLIQKPDNTIIPMIKKHLVDVNSPAFKKLQLYRKVWSLEDSYRFPGPLQLHYPPETSSDTLCPFTLLLNSQQKPIHKCTEIPC